MRDDDRRENDRPAPRPHSERPPRPAQTGKILLLVLVVGGVGLLLLGGVALVILAPFYLAYKDDSQVDRARADVKMIGDACSNYNNRYGEHPNSLADLVNPPNNGRAYFTEDHLRDPWGNYYQYDPSQCRPGTGEPLVYTINPDNGQQISNWQLHAGLGGSR